MAQAGIIKSITGIVTALNPQGEIRQLQIGDIVYENEIINTDSGASASIELDNGQVIDLAENAQALLDQSVTGPVEPSDAVIGEVEALQAALEEGEDITEDEETAAGEEDDGFDYGLAYAPGDQTGGDVGSYLFGTEYDAGADVPPDDPGTVEEQTALVFDTAEVFDPIDTTTVTLDDVTVDEAGTITYTASVNNAPQGAFFVTLSNGVVINFADGALIGSSAPQPPQGEDPYVDGDSFTVSIAATSGGNYGGVDTTDTALVTIADTIDTTTVTLDDVTVDEAGTITYTASVNNAPQGSFSVTLNNGVVINFADGSLSGASAPQVAQGDEFYVAGESFTISIASTSGGNYEAVDTTDTALVIINDTIDTTTVTLDDVTVDEAGTITYTASVNNAPQGPFSVTLSNGVVINFADGSLIGSSAPQPPQGDDPYVDGDSFTVSIAGTSGGNYGAIDTTDTALVTIADTIDTTTVTLDDVTVDEAGTITYTASVNNAPQGSFFVTLNNGVVINFADGSLSGASAPQVAQGDDPYVDGESFTVSIASTSGGNYEALDTTDTALVTIQDTIDKTTVTVTESTNTDDGVTYYTYTAIADNTPDNGASLVLNLDNGESITINNGETIASSASSSTQATSGSSSNIDGEDGNYEHLDIVWAFGDSAEELVRESSLVDDIPDNSTVTGTLILNDSDNLTVTNVSLTATGGTSEGILDPTTGIMTLETAAGMLEIYTQDYAGQKEGYYKYTLENPTKDVVAPDDTPDYNSVENFVYTVEYNTGLSVNATLTVTIVDDVPTIEATNLAIPNIESDFQGSYTFDIGADTQAFTDSFNATSLKWTNNPDSTKYSLDYDQINSTDTSKIYNVTYENGDGDPSTFFTVTVNSDGTYNFNLITPEPVTTTTIENILQGITGGSKLPSYTFDSSTFDNHFSLKVTGYSEGVSDTLTISNTDLGVGDNVMHGRDVDMLKFDVLPEAGNNEVSISEMTIQLSETASVKTTDSVKVSIDYTDGSSSDWTSQVIGSDYDIDIVPDSSKTVDFIRIMPADDGVQFKITGVAVSYDVTQYPDDYNLNFSLTGTDADGDSATTNFTVAVSAADADSGTYEITGTTGDDYVYGTDDGDVLDGDDGNDTIFFDADDISVDGGGGYDTLLVHDTSGTLDFSRISNVEAVDLDEDGTNQDVTLNLDQVLDIVGNGGTLEIAGGDTGDIIRFNDGNIADGDTAQWTSSGNGDGSFIFTHVDSSRTVNVVPVDDADNHIQVDGNIDI